MFFKNLCFPVLWTKVASALDGLKDNDPAACLPSKNLKATSQEDFIHVLLTMECYGVVIDMF